MRVTVTPITAGTYAVRLVPSWWGRPFGRREQDREAERCVFVGWAWSLNCQTIIDPDITDALDAAHAVAELERRLGERTHR